uniref:ubiquitinyl hydrolase 1 n=1 Tax=Xenopsylla cheopis TaxID=163159 RepID=A0A6M2DKB4_XENCH
MTIKPSKKSSTAKNEDSNESQAHNAQNTATRAQNRSHTHSIPSSHPTGEISLYGSHTSTYEEHTPSTSKRRVRCSPHRSTNRCKLRSENKRDREPREPKKNSSRNSSPVPSCSEKETKVVREHSGYNSGDEYSPRPDQRLTEAEWEARDKRFETLINSRGLEVREMVNDGACLFRAISDQIFGDQDMHSVVRQNTMDYIYQNRDYFAQYVTEDFNSYVNRKRHENVHGNHVEIQAVSEMYNRPIEVYIYAAEPVNVFNATEHNSGYEPIRLSYQRGSHYNSIRNPWKATVGIGLGLAGYHPGEADINQLNDAVKESEDLLIEQTMLEDKLKATDWEATNEAIEEQVARESYLQWCKDNERRKKQSSSSTESSSTVTSMELRGSPRSRTSGGCASPHLLSNSLKQNHANSQRKASYSNHDFFQQMQNYKDLESIDLEIYKSNGLIKEDVSQSYNRSQFYDPYLLRYVAAAPIFQIQNSEPILYLRAEKEESSKVPYKKGMKSFFPADVYEQRLSRSVSPQSKCERISRNNSPSARSCDISFESSRLTRKNVIDLENALYEVIHNPSVLSSYKKSSNIYVQSNDSSSICSDDEVRAFRKRNSADFSDIVSEDGITKKRTAYGNNNSEQSHSSDELKQFDGRISMKKSRDKRDCFYRYGRRLSRSVVLPEDVLQDLEDEKVSHNLRSRSISFPSHKSTNVSQEKTQKKSLLRSPSYCSSNTSSQGSRSASPLPVTCLSSIQEDAAPSSKEEPNGIERLGSPKASTSKMSDFHRSLYEGLQAYESSQAGDAWGETNDLRMALAASELEYYAQLKRTHETSRQKHDPMAPSTSHRIP